MATRPKGSWFFLSAVICALAGSAAGWCPPADLNGNCWVTLSDVQIFVEQWLDPGACEGEPSCANFDGVHGVDFADFSFLASYWQTHGIPLAINEFMASNNSDSDINDPQGDFDDWIEIYNFGDTPINLAGMHLTDNLADPNKWQIPAGYPTQTTIPADGFLVFWADNEISQGPLHTNFKLSADGEDIGLADANGALIDSISFGEQLTNISYGRYPDAEGSWRFFPTPTPGAHNNGPYLGEIENVEFSHERGFYDTGFDVTIATTTNGADIYYTTDGSKPVENEVNSPTSSPYTGAIHVSSTTCLRAAAIKAGWMPSPTETHTYIFLGDVITQSPSGERPDPNWPPPHINTNPYEDFDQFIDYGMDPCVLNDARYTGLVDDALLALPTISIVTDLDNLFDPTTGIYMNPQAEGIAWERPASVELIYPDGNEGFQIDAGLRIRGGWSRHEDNPKHAFRLFFRSEYGQAKLNYPLFGTEGVDEFDSMDLRTSQNYSWSYYGDPQNTMVRDVFSRDMQRDMGQPYTRSRYYHLYINGQYWGLFQTQERSEADYAASYFGGEKEDYDVIKSDGWPSPADYAIMATDGNLAAYENLWQAATAGFSTDAAYYGAQGLKPDGTCDPSGTKLLDIDNLIDYMLCVYYTGDRDGPISSFRSNTRPNNLWAIYNRNKPDGFKFFRHDCEHALDTGLEDRTGPYDNWELQQFEYFTPQWLSQELTAHPEYVMRFADRVHKHFFNGGTLTPQPTAAGWTALANDINLAIIAESVRWGDVKCHPPRTKDDDWLPTINNVTNNYLPSRTEVVIDQLRNQGWYPDVNAPVFNYLDGYIYMDNPNGSGTIYYTLDGSDPRLPASLLTPGTEVTLVTENAAKRYLVPTGPVVPSTGSILREYWTGISGWAVSDLTSSPDFPDNPSGSNLPTSFEAPTNWADNYGTRIRGHLHPPTTGSYTFWIASDDSSELWLSTSENPANKTKIAYAPSWTSPREWTKYASQQSSAKSLVAGQKYYIEALMKEGGGGDNLAAAWQGPGITRAVIDGQYLSPAYETWFTSQFDDSSWPSGTGGVGYERNPGDPVNYIGLFNIDVNSTMYGNNTTCYIRVPFTAGNAKFSNMTLKVRYDDGFVAYLNGVEVARRNFSGTPAWDSNATTLNPDDNAVNLEPIDISDHVNLLQRGDNVLAIHGLNVSKTSTDFLISAELVATAINYGEISPGAIEYAGDFELDKSTNLKARIYKSGTGQWSALNEAVYEVGNVRNSLRITEIMYHPLDTNDPNDPNTEYIELKNVGGSTINLNLVQFDKGIDFTFGPDTLTAGQHVLVVKDINAFEAKYGTWRNIAGQYDGSLDNAGEKIRLKDALGTTILDFDYKDGWRDITDGDGYSLTIINPADPNVNNWGRKDGWRPSAYINGSPGWDDSGIVPNPGTIVINEVMAHSHAGAPDWIELYNTTAGSINISGWFLSDSDANIMKYEFKSGTSIAAHSCLVVYEDANFGPNSIDPGRHIGFALSENGDTVCLSSGLDANSLLTGYRNKEDFGASETGISFGRYYKAGTNNYNFVPMDHNTPGQTNAYPKVGPIVITEIMYHPNWPANGSYANDEYEYIELYNSSASSVTLYDSNENAPWKFTDGIDYTFGSPPDAVTIAAGARIVVVKNVDAFRWRYPTVPVGIIYGPYDGWLDNGGEKLELGKPGDIDEWGTRQYIRVERVDYSDGSHPGGEPGDVDLWPTNADGAGDSLNRDSMTQYGNDPNNWSAATPTPGS